MTTEDQEFVKEFESLMELEDMDDFYQGLIALGRKRHERQAQKAQAIVDKILRDAGVRK